MVERGARVGKEDRFTEIVIHEGVEELFPQPTEDALVLRTLDGEVPDSLSVYVNYRYVSRIHRTRLIASAATAVTYYLTVQKRCFVLCAWIVPRAKANGKATREVNPHSFQSLSTSDSERSRPGLF